MIQRLIRESDQVCLVNRLAVADRFIPRLKGLIGVRNFEPGEGLLFPRCNSVHMWMMTIPIDVVFLKSLKSDAKSKWKIVSIHPDLKPWKLLPVSNFGADDTLELPAGMTARLNLHPGEVLCIAS